MIFQNNDGGDVGTGASPDVLKQSSHPITQEDIRTQNRLRMLLKQIPTLVWTTDRELRITSSSGSGLAALKSYADHDVGKTLLDFLDNHDPDLEPVLAHRRALEGERVSYRVSYMGRLLDAYVEPERALDGAIIGVSGFALDITEHPDMEKPKDFTARTVGAHLIGVPVPTYIWEKEGNEFYLRHSNEAGRQITQGKIDQKIGMSASELHANRPDILEALHRCHAEKNAISFETDYHFQTTGEARRLAVTFASVPPSLVIVHLDDVTEISKAREALKMKDLAIASSINGVLFTDMEGRITYVNHACCVIWDIEEPEDLLGRLFETLWSNPEEARHFLDMTLWEGGHIAEMSGCREDESAFEVQISGSVVCDDSGRPACYMATLMDVSDRNTLSRALNLAQVSLDSAMDGIVWVGPDNHILYANRALRTITGYNQEELTSMSIQDLNPEASGEIISKYKSEIRSGRPRTDEMFFLAKDGRRIPVEVTTVFVNYEGHAFFSSHVRDITRRKAEEEKIRRIHEIYRQAIQNADEVPYLLNFDTERYDFFGEEGEALLGLHPDVMTWSDFSSRVRENTVIDPDATGDVYEYGNAFLRGEISRYQMECRFITPSGQEKWLADYAVPVKDEITGRVTGALGILRDITYIKKAFLERAALCRLSRDMLPLTSVAELGPLLADECRRRFRHDAFWFSLYDETSRQYTGIYAEDTPRGAEKPVIVEGDTSLYVSRRKPVFGDGLPKLINREEELKESPLVAFGCEERISRSLMYAPILMNGNIEGVISVQSYTPNCYNEEDLRFLQSMANHCGGALRRISSMEALKIHEKAMNCAMTAMCLVDEKGKIIHANPAFHSLWDIESGMNLQGRAFRNFWFFPAVADKTLKVIRETGSWSGEATGCREDREKFDIRITAAVVPDEKGNFLCSVFSLQDVSGEKLSKKALSLAQHSMNCSNDAIVWIDSDIKVFYVNEAACLMMGYTQDEFIGHSVAEFDIRFPKPFDTDMWSAVKERRFFVSETEIRHKNGHIIPVEASSLFIEYDGREFVVSSLRDITERRESIERQRETDAKYRAVIENADCSIAMINHDGIFLMVNPAAAAHFGKRPEDIAGKTHWDLFPKEIADIQMANVRKVIETGEPLNVLDWQTSIQGEDFWCRVDIRPMYDVRGNITCAQVMIFDVTPLMKKEQMIEAANKKLACQHQSLRTILKYQKTPVCSIFDSGRIAWCNQAFCDMLAAGREPETLEGESLGSFFDPEDTFASYLEEASRIAGETGRDHRMISLKSRDGRSCRLDVLMAPFFCEECHANYLISLTSE